MYGILSPVFLHNCLNAGFCAEFVSKVMFVNVLYIINDVNKVVVEQFSYSTVQMYVDSLDSKLDSPSSKFLRIENRVSRLEFRVSIFEVREPSFEVEFRVSRHSKNFLRISPRDFEEMI